MVQKTPNKKTAQAIQNDIFRKMTPEKKIRMASKFYAFARKINKEGIAKWNKRSSSKK